MKKLFRKIFKWAERMATENNTGVDDELYQVFILAILLSLIIGISFTFLLLTI